MAVESGISIRPIHVGEHGPSWCALGLVAHEQDIVFGIIKALFQMRYHSATGKHAASGDDDAGAGPDNFPYPQITRIIFGKSDILLI